MDSELYSACYAGFRKSARGNLASEVVVALIIFGGMHMLGMGWFLPILWAILFKGMVTRRLPWARQYYSLRQDLINMSFGTMPPHSYARFSSIKNLKQIGVVVHVHSRDLLATFSYLMNLPDGKVLVDEEANTYYETGMLAHDDMLRRTYEHLCQYTQLN